MTSKHLLVIGRTPPPTIFIIQQVTRGEDNVVPRWENLQVFNIVIRTGLISVTFFQKCCRSWYWALAMPSELGKVQTGSKQSYSIHYDEVCSTTGSTSLQKSATNTFLFFWNEGNMTKYKNILYILDSKLVLQYLLYAATTKMLVFTSSFISFENKDHWYVQTQI